MTSLLRLSFYMRCIPTVCFPLGSWRKVLAIGAVLYGHCAVPVVISMVTARYRWQQACAVCISPSAAATRTSRICMFGYLLHTQCCCCRGDRQFVRHPGKEPVASQVSGKMFYVLLFILLQCVRRGESGRVLLFILLRRHSAIL